MAKYINVNEVLEAQRFAERVRNLVDGPGGIRELTETVRVYAQSIARALEGIEHECLDMPADRLQALHNLNKGFADNSNLAQRGISVLVRMMLGHPPTEAEAGAVTRTGLSPDEIRTLDAEASSRLASALDMELFDEPPNPVIVASPLPISAPPAPVVGNRRSRLYHPCDNPATERIAPSNRIEFPSAEAAEIAGFRLAGDAHPRKHRQSFSPRPNPLPAGCEPTET